MTNGELTFILVCVLIYLMLCAQAAARDLRRERITQERHDANARTMAHIEAVRRGE